MSGATSAGTGVMRGVRAAVAPAAKRALFWAGGYALTRAVLPSRRLAILRYHAVCEPEADYADPGICVSPSAFERHIAYLASHYAVLPLPEAVAVMKRGATLPRNAVAITFDDGYADNLLAARMLARHGLTATFYITAGCLDGGEPFWPAEIRALIAAVKAPGLRLSAGGAHADIPLGNDNERRAAIRSVSKLLKAHPIPTRESLREQIRRAAGHPEVPSCMLTWEQLAEMDRLGMTIGSHTMTHPNLPNAGEADAWLEIRDSKARLERELGKAVTMFSYPNGGAERYVTTAVAGLVHKAGFDAATTSRNAFASARSDPYALERVQIAERLDDLAFALEIERFAFRPVPRPSERNTDADHGC
jgi:peptidoglycan/xylan/chitin deacetylase (PgdA/CDA1 family)